MAVSIRACSGKKVLIWIIDYDSNWSVGRMAHYVFRRGWFYSGNAVAGYRAVCDKSFRNIICVGVDLSHYKKPLALCVLSCAAECLYTDICSCFNHQHYCDFNNLHCVFTCHHKTEIELFVRGRQMNAFLLMLPLLGIR